MLLMCPTVLSYLFFFLFVNTLTAINCFVNCHMLTKFYCIMIKSKSIVVNFIKTLNISRCLTMHYML